MKKHAYLIMAHDNFYILEKLIQLIDYDLNDIYIHIDKKAKNFNFNYFRNLVNKSNIYFVKRFNVRWGGYSIVEAELELLNKAIKGEYEYYHIISGVDLPLKSQEYIHKFFNANRGKEFINIEKIESTSWRDIEIKNRVKLYHFINNIVNLRSKNRIITFLRKIQDKLINLQVKLHVDRYKADIWYGSNWCSITNECVKYLLDNIDTIIKDYKYTHASDELFIQNIIAENTKLMNDIYKWEKDSNMRLIDWNRGNPYVFKSSDFEELIKSDMLFARKFDCSVDKKIIDKIYSFINNN